MFLFLMLKCYFLRFLSICSMSSDWLVCGGEFPCVTIAYSTLFIHRQLRKLYIHILYQLYFFIIAEMYTYTISFGALYSLISWQASISFLSNLSWRSNQSNKPTMTLDSTKNSRAKMCTKPLQFPHAIILQTQRIFQHEHIAREGIL